MKFTRKFVLVSNERYDEMQKKLLEQKLQPEKPDMEKIKDNMVQEKVCKTP